MKKRVLAALLASATVLSVAGCSNNASTSTTDSGNTSDAGTSTSDAGTSTSTGSGAGS